MEFVRPFQPDAKATVQATAAVSSARVALGGTGPQVRVNNTGTVDAFVEFGDSTVAATVPSGATAGSLRVAAGTVEIFTLSQSFTNAAAITSASTSVVEFTRGEGN